jgi:hypothetical protein
MAHFHTDLAFGQSGEERVLALFSSFGFLCGRCDGKSHDLWVEVNGERLTCEVKTERKFSVTGNIAVEHWNPRQNKPSGISASQSDLWVTVLADSIWMVPTLTLRQFVDNLRIGPGVRHLKRVGDGNADCWIIRGDLLLGPVYRELQSPETMLTFVTDSARLFSAVGSP